MSVTRRRVLEELAAASDASREQTTTIDALAATLDTERGAVQSHLDGLVACELARFETDGTIRVTLTGEELLNLDTDDMVIVDPSTASSGR